MKRCRTCGERYETHHVCDLDTLAPDQVIEISPASARAAGDRVQPLSRVQPLTEQITLLSLTPKGKGTQIGSARVRATTEWPAVEVPGGFGFYGSGAGAFLDWYDDQMQIIVEDSNEDPAIHVKLNADGTISGIVVRDDLMRLVRPERAVTEGAL